MSEFNLPKTLIVVGLGLAALGAVMFVLSKWGIELGRLPGDIRIEGKNGGFYFPIVTCIVISVVGTLIVNWLGKR